MQINAKKCIILGMIQFCSSGNAGIPWIYAYCLYYSYTRCKEHLDIDSIFQLTMDESLKGNSITVANNDSETPPSSEESKLT